MFLAAVKDAIQQSLRLLRTTSRRGTTSSLDSALYVNLIGATFELDDTNRRWLTQEYTRESEAVDSPLQPGASETASPPQAVAGNSTPAAHAAPAPVALVVPFVPASEMPHGTMTLTCIGAWRFLLPLLCCAVLCCAVLCCAVLCCAVLCCAVLCCAGAVLCCAGAALCYAVLCWC
jgi:hypothetical protein